MILIFHLIAEFESLSSSRAIKSCEDEISFQFRWINKVVLVFSILCFLVVTLTFNAQHNNESTALVEAPPLSKISNSDIAGDSPTKINDDQKIKAQQNNNVTALVKEPQLIILKFDQGAPLLFHLRPCDVTLMKPLLRAWKLKSQLQLDFEAPLKCWSLAAIVVLIYILKKIVTPFASFLLIRWIVLHLSRHCIDRLN